MGELFLEVSVNFRDEVLVTLCFERSVMQINL
jgi:hypothetical protein